MIGNIQSKKLLSLGPGDLVQHALGTLARRMSSLLGLSFSHCWLACLACLLVTAGHRILRQQEIHENECNVHYPTTLRLNPKAHGAT